MEGYMKAAVMKGIGEIGFTQRAIPLHKSDEVLVKIEYVGICGSDIHYYEHGRIGDFVVKPPFVLGHEAAGTVVEVGDSVQHLQVGDRVSMEPGSTCGHCEFCKSGRYNLCPDVRFFATPPVEGVFQEYTAHKADLCFKLPAQVSALEGALIEPLAVGFHAARQGGAQAGQTAVIMGAGCIGLVTLMALRAMGVSKVAVVDVVEKRLEKAKELGAFCTVWAGKENVEDAIMNFTGRKGVELGIDTAGTETTIRQLIRVAKKGSVVVLVGYSAEDKICFPVNMALDKELTFKTIFRYRNIYPMAIEAVADGRIPIRKIVTDEFCLEDLQEAMDACIRRKNEIVKAVVKII